MGGDYSKITIQGDNDPLKSALDEGFAMFREWGEKIKYTVQDLVGAHSFDELWSKVKAGVDAFEQTQKGLRELKYEMKATGDVTGLTVENMKEMNVQLHKIIDASEDEITAAQKALLEYTNVRNRADGNFFQQSIKAAADLSAAIGGDLVSNTRRLGEVLQSPKDSFDQLEKLGVKFTASQKQLITVLQSTGKGVEAQKMILKALADVYGGAGEEAANTFGARLNKLNEYFDSTWKKIGGFLVPYLNKFIEALEKVNRVLDYYQAELVKWFENLWNGMSKTLGGGTDWLKKFGEAAVVAFTIAQAAFQEWDSFLIGGFFKVLQVVRETFEKITPIITKWMEYMAPVWDAVVTASSAAWNTIKEMAKDAFEYLAEWGKWLVEQFKKVFESIVNIWQVTLGTMKGMATHALANMFGGKTDFSTIWRGFKQGLGNNMPKFDGPPGLPGGGAGGLGDKAADWTKRVNEALKGFFEKFKSGAGDLWAGLDKDMKPFFDKYATLLAGNSSSFDEFYKKIQAIMNGDPYANVGGKGKGDFGGPGSEDGTGASGRSGGGLEDLVALNRRITGATAKSPEVRELEKQTNLQSKSVDLLAGIRANTQARAERAEREKNLTLAGAGFQGAGF